jgi:hypothetical protein
MNKTAHCKFGRSWLRSAGLGLVIFVTLTTTNSGGDCNAEAEFKSLILADNPWAEATKRYT